MSNPPKVWRYKTLPSLAKRLRDDFKSGGNDFILLFAYNGTGKTRLSMTFKDAEKRKEGVERDTLYFNAFTEDLFIWDNDLPGDSRRVLRFNSDSRFFDAFKELEMESRIQRYLQNYADFEFDLDYEESGISFSRGDDEHIKVSRGEENVFIWCVFLALAEAAIDGAQAYDWVKYLYIDDPISSLDDNNAIAVAVDLAKLLRRGKDRLKTVVSSHHSLFFNVMVNELKKQQASSYFLHKTKNGEGLTLRRTTDTPFFHHVAMLSELKAASESGTLYTHHFNTLRSVLEKTATFFGHDDFSECLGTSSDEGLHSRAMNLLSHGKYALYEPREMVEDNKALFREILDGFLARYAFALPVLESQATAPRQP